MKDTPLPHELRIPSAQTTAETLELAELGKRARIVFHDLSNHLTALSLSVGQLEENLARDTAQLQEYSKRSEKTRQQIEYVAGLLRSHIENVPDSYFEPVIEIANVVENFYEKARAAGIKILIKIQNAGPQKAGIKIFGSRHVFAHIATNLISNAIESFTPMVEEKKRDRNQTETSGSRNISIILKTTARYFCLSVTDTGSGIPPSTLPYIFDSKYTTKSTGHGIGLSATKEFVERAFGGNISVQTEVGKGTTFRVEIPHQQKARRNMQQNRKRISLPVFVQTI